MSDQHHYLVSKLKELASELGRVPMMHEFTAKLPRVDVFGLFGTYDKMLMAAGLMGIESDNEFKHRQPRIGFLDIETKPIKAHVWDLWDQNIGIEMIIEDWSVLSWAFKWLGKDEIFYQDLSQNVDYTKDELIVRGVWELLDQADVVIGQNSDKFDIKKLQAKFEEYGLGQPSYYKSIDTLKIMKKHLGLTSKKLAFATDKYNKKYKKLKHDKYPGVSLWLECLKGNQDAWECMKEYNCWDVLSLEELYIDHLRKWDKSINYGVYTGEKHCCANCGSTDLSEGEYSFTKTGAFKNYRCNVCNSNLTSKNNEISDSLKKSLLK